VLGAGAPPAIASHNQEAIFLDGPSLDSNPVGTLATLRELGVTRLRLTMAWSSLAPGVSSSRRPSHFRATDPAQYPAARWALYDTIIRTAAADGVGIDLDLTGGAPLWATGPGMPSDKVHLQWKPSARQFGYFVRAVGTRYSGRYRPPGSATALPRVDFWSIWNEPNYGPDLAPQAIDHDRIEVGAAAYRKILDYAWTALHRSGHGRDTILIGETAPRGLDHPIGNFSGVKPLRFLRALYCVDSRYRRLRGAAARARSCPTTTTGSRRFRSQHPALFNATGFSDHPYEQGTAPNRPTYACGRGVCSSAHRSDPDYADLPELGRLGRTLDRLNRVYGSRTRFPLWNTEYGYRTNPPEKVPGLVSPTTAAEYMNWAEYLSWRQPRVRSYNQYLLVDPAGFFDSGLEYANGRHKPTYDAFRLPLFLPRTSTPRGRAIEVWGCARPAHLAIGPQPVQIQFRPAGGRGWSTVRTVQVTNARGYFDVRQPFTRSGQVRLRYSYPGGQTVFSRTVGISVG
jgi:hypothetical protein